MGIADMFPDIKLLQSNITLYNNLACYKEHQGRLSSRLEVFPLPQILWDFEVIGEEVKQKGGLRTGYPMLPLRGYQFVIEQPLPTMDTHNYVVPLESLSGIANEALFGDLGFRGHSFRFYLPNTRFQSISLFGQQRIEKHHQIGSEEIGTEPGGRRVEAKLDDTWRITLRTTEEALTWLNEQKNNIGTQITAFGILHSAQGDQVKFVDYPTLTLREAETYIQTLSGLLSFLNGGYTGALFIETGHYYSPGESVTPPSALALTPRVTPLELLGTSWCTYDSDLSAYLSCFQSLRRMLAQSPWNETYGLVLSWYFQAVQPEIMSGGKMWQIVANALGTALERLSYTILVLEENDPLQKEKLEILFSPNIQKAKKVWGLGETSPSVKRLQLLLERIGISLNRGFWDVNEIREFVEVRNEATHPKKGDVNRNDIGRILEQATQWVYEVILWRLGYPGNYLIMTAPGRQSIPCRYDLNSRNPNW
jgi:hypothetical protein